MRTVRKSKLRQTPQRLAIMEFLNGNKDHPSAEDIYREVSKEYPTMSFATVYNTLEVLKKRNDVFELTIDPERKRYDPGTDRHHHLICLECKKIIDVHGDFTLNVSEEDKQDFHIVGNHVEFYGFCKDCKDERR